MTDTDLFYTIMEILKWGSIVGCFAALIGAIIRK